MESIKQQRVASVVKRALSEIFVNEAKDWFHDTMITVTVVRVTKDLKLAKVYLSIYGVSDKDTVLQEIQIFKSQIKNLMVQKIRYQLRWMHDLQFFIDDSLDYIEKIDNILHKK
jgi:ribosome-binding factor A